MDTKTRTSNLNLYQFILYDGYNILIYKPNGYMNATQLCSAFAPHKDINTWCEDTRKIQKIVSEKLDIADIVITITDAGIAHNGVYINSYLLPHLLQWLDPNYCVKVSKIMCASAEQSLVYSAPTSHAAEVITDVYNKIQDMQRQILQLTSQVNSISTQNVKLLSLTLYTHSNYSNIIFMTCDYDSNDTLPIINENAKKIFSTTCKNKDPEKIIAKLKANILHGIGQVNDKYITLNSCVEDVVNIIKHIEL
jgi:hypothetical protein